MTTAVAQLTSLVHDPDRYNIANSDIRDLQIQAMNERFQQRKDTIKLLAHRAKQANLTAITCLEDAVPLLFPHTAYKSYPERFLMDEKWDKLGKWMNTVSSYPVPPRDPSKYHSIDDWLAHLEEEGFYVSCSSGTTGNINY